MALEIGKMRDWFSIRERTKRQNKYGETVPGSGIPEWEEVSGGWGYLRTLSGRQISLAQINTVTSSATHELIMRYDAKITVNTRLFLALADGKERSFTINSLNDVDNRHAELVMTVTEVRG